MACLDFFGWWQHVGPWTPYLLQKYENELSNHAQQIVVFCKHANEGVETMCTKTLTILGNLKFWNGCNVDLLERWHLQIVSDCFTCFLNFWHFQLWVFNCAGTYNHEESHNYFSKILNLGSISSRKMKWTLLAFCNFVNHIATHLHCHRAT